jgi:hypothetical protein
MLSSSANITYTAFLGSQQLPSYYRTTLSNSDSTPATASTIFIAFILLTGLAVGWRYCRPEFSLWTLDSTVGLIPCLIFSSGLREDIKG